MSSSLSVENRIFFAVGTGRCGTKFLAKVCDLEVAISSVHERNPLNEAFHRYCKWYGVNVDNAGFLETKRSEIEEDLADASFSFEASSYLSLSIEELYEHFNAKFILLARRPEKVVTSFLRKGWYEKPIVRSNPNLPPSFQESSKSHHFLSRIIPSGNKYSQWRNMSRLGQIAWYWNTINASVIKQFENIPESHWRIEKLEDFSYDRYLKLADFIGFRPGVSEVEYRSLAMSRPNALDNLRSMQTWNKIEMEEFEQEVIPMARYFGYEYLAEELISREQHETAALML